MSDPRTGFGQVDLPPMDQFNQTLIGNVHPPEWINPQPPDRYNLAVIGAGTAGLVTAAVAAALGAKVALIERHLMGGDCLNVGCVPSKGVIRASRAWAEVHRAAEYGIDFPEGIRYDFGRAMARMRKIRAKISEVDSAHRYTKLGVDVYLGQGSFTGPDTIQVRGTAGDRTLRFVKAAVCTGARAAAPPIPGLQDVEFLTNETVFSLTERPSSLAVIGAGPIGCELAQAFSRFGSTVYLFEALHGILPNEDREAAELVHGSLQRDGVQLFCCGKDLKIQATDQGKRLTVESHGHHHDIHATEILVGVGRAPNVEGLNLDAAGVEYDRSGINVNDHLQTANPRIYAAGDVCSRYKFTHAADAMAQIVIQNALFPHPLGLGTAKVSSLLIPWCTYTQPEIAHVGLYEHEAQAQGLALDTFTFELREVDRAVLDGEDEGFAKVHVRKGTDHILGATVVATHAGDLISEITVAMKAGIGLNGISSTIHPYPTQAEVIKRVANAWRKTTLTERKKHMLARWFAWTRKS